MLLKPLPLCLLLAKSNDIESFVASGGTLIILDKTSLSFTVRQTLHRLFTTNDNCYDVDDDDYDIGKKNGNINYNNNYN